MTSQKLLETILEELSQPPRSMQEMPRRVELCRQALSLVNCCKQPESWGLLQFHIGNSLAQNPRGERADNLEQAIYHYTQALKIRTRVFSPTDWARTQNNLAVAYRSRIRGERADNLEQAIYHFNQTLEVYTLYAFPESWAMIQNNLAVAYSERIRDGRAVNLEQAIYHYNQALKIYTRDAFPESWAMTQNNLATAYSERIRGERSDNLEQAIYHYNQALEVYMYDAFPEAWAGAQNNLANAYSGRIRGERADNMEQAIYHYNQALEVYTRDDFPEDWAGTQNNLANAYSDRIRGERADNMEQAIYHYKQALEIRTCDVFSGEWARTQNNLANAYRSRIQGERADNLEQAIYHYNQALKIRIRDTFPEEWAKIQNNLAAAYSDRIRGERADNLEQAIYYYNQALEVSTRDTLPEEWAKIQNNLAAAYSDRIRGERADNLEQAIYHYKQALEIRTCDAFPEKWARTQNNLANVYRCRIRGERSDNLEQAIYHFSQALGIFRRDAFPEDWAMTQNNLASAYRSRIRGERADNLEQAIFHYNQALEINTRNAFPTRYLMIQRNLGELLFCEQRWTAAFAAFQNAINTGNDLLISAYSETGRQAEINETAQLFSQAGYCLLQTHKYGEALSTLERGKTRLLTEILAIDDMDTKVLPERQRILLQAARQTVRMLEAEMRLPLDTPARRSDRELAGLLRIQRAGLNAIIGDIRGDCPDFMPSAVTLDKILQLIPHEGALIVPLITSQGSAIFVIPKGAKKVLKEHVVFLADFKADDLKGLLFGAEDQNGWLSAYGIYRNTRHSKNWHIFIDEFSKKLWNILVAPIYRKLAVSNIKRLLVIPSGGMQLLPFHAAWRLDENGQKCALLDDYEITYAPSSYAYAIAHRRAAAQTGDAALIVGINEYKNALPLKHAASEAQTIANIFKVDPMHPADATKSNIKANVAGKAYIHFSCHAFFNRNEPMCSFLVLNDETLTLSEIVSELDLHSARLITLSACETGISDIRKSPDEYMGLPAGFLQAGASAIVSSLWSVDDRSTALLMERFYHNHLERDMPYSAALREAQLWLRGVTIKELGDYYYIRMTTKDDFVEYSKLIMSGNPDDHPYDNPYYWAAFTINGADKSV